MKTNAETPRKKTPKSKGATATKPAEEWLLRLYVAGQTPKSIAAFANLKKVCDEHLPDRYWIEVIDLSLHPHLAQNDQIVALPTLVRKQPEPVKRIIGDLSNQDRVKIGMDLKPEHGM